MEKLVERGRKDVEDKEKVEHTTKKQGKWEDEEEECDYDRSQESPSLQKEEEE